MPYVDRDEEGNIVGIYLKPQRKNQEKVEGEVFLHKSAEQLRAENYPPIEKQLEMMYDDLMNGTDTWKNAIRAVREAYPKPEK